jgi:hypothetical protein
MEKVNFKIEQEDLKVLFLHTKHAYGNMTFDEWVEDVKDAYKDFIKDKEDPKTFSEWVNGQIIWLTQNAVI